MKTLAVVNLKGGTGKTSIAVHLAEGARLRDKRVLLGDLDAQASATLWLTGSVPSAGGMATALRTGKLAAELVTPVENRPGLSLLAASPDLAGIDVALAAEIGGETLLRRALSKHAEAFDLAVLDCPPSLSLSVLNALVAADEVLVPVVASYLGLAGLGRITETIERIGERLDVHPRLIGVVLFAADAREGITGDTRTLLRAELGDGVLMRASVRVSSAAKVLPEGRRLAFDRGADPRGAEDYGKLVTEVLRRLEGKGAA